MGAKADLEQNISVLDEYAYEEVERFDFFNYIKVSSKSGLNVNEAFEFLTLKLMGEEGKEFLAKMKKKYDFFSATLL